MYCSGHIDQMSHPTVGVALFGPKFSDGLSSLSEEPAVNNLLVYLVIILGLAHTVGVPVGGREQISSK